MNEATTQQKRVDRSASRDVTFENSSSGFEPIISCSSVAPYPLETLLHKTFPIQLKLSKRLVLLYKSMLVCLPRMLSNFKTKLIMLMKKNSALSHFSTLALGNILPLKIVSYKIISHKRQTKCIHLS